VPLVSELQKTNAFDIFLQKFEPQVKWQLIILLLLPFFIYIKVAGYEFIDMDDISIISNNYHIIGSIKNIGIAFKTDAFISATGDFYRPVQTVSFMIDALIGKDKPWIYHLSNLIYHLLTVLALFTLLRKLGLKNSIAFLMSLIFAIHPVLSSNVSWIAARGDILVGLWGILMLLTFHNFTKTKKQIQFFLHVLIFMTALFTKETTVAFPLIFLLYYFVVLKEKFNAKTLVPFVVLWALALSVFFYMRSKVVINTPPDFILGIKPFISNLAALPILLGKFFVPVVLSTMPLFTNIATLIGVVVLIFCLIFLYQSVKNRKSIMLCFGFVWFLVFVIPPMFFKLYYSKHLLEYYEHRAYLPYIGLVFMIGFWLNEVIIEKKKIGILGASFAAAVIFIPLASFHSDNFKNTPVFFGSAAEQRNPGAAVTRGVYYMTQRDFANALVDFNDAIEYSNGQYPLGFLNRAKIYTQVNKNHQLAEQDLTQTILLDSTIIEAYILRADERISLQNMQGALQDLEKAKKLDANNAAIYFTAGKVLVSANKFPDAEVNFSKAIALDSLYSEAYNDRAFARYRMQSYDKALADCNKAIELNPVYLNAFYNKGMIYYETAKYDKAIKTLDTTLALANNFYFGFFYRGMAKKQTNDMKRCLSGLASICKSWLYNGTGYY
jgi:tetratricopeptide (TPR) repeat protein